MFRYVNRSAGPASCSLENTCGCKALAGISTADGVSAHLLFLRGLGLFLPVRFALEICDQGLGLLAQLLALILDLKAQLPQVFNIELVFAGTPVLRVGDTYLQFAQAGAIRLHIELHGRIKSVAAAAAPT